MACFQNLQVAKVAELEEIVGQLTEERQELEQSHAEVLETQVNNARQTFFSSFPPKQLSQQIFHNTLPFPFLGLCWL